MTHTKSILITGSLFFLSACAPNEVPIDQGGYYHSGIYFGANFSSTYKKGIKDGCTTAKGDYKKSHWFFKNKKDYADGWFSGRNKCRPKMLARKG